MKTRNEQLLEAVQQKRDEIRQKSAAILEKHAEENRNPTDDEAKELAQFVKDMKTLDEQEADYQKAVKVEKDVLGIGKEIGSQQKGLELKNGLDSIEQVYQAPPTLGEALVNSEQFKSLQASGFSGNWTTGPIELQTKGTLLSGTSSPGSGTGGGLLPVPGVIPGVVRKLFQPLSVADVIAPGQVAGNTLRYIVEGTATSGAAGVAEAGAKPESTVALSTVDEPVKKIATIINVSDEMLEDGPAVQSYLNERLSLFVRIEEERQIVLGAGTNELVGITGRSGVNTYALGTVDNNAIGLFKAINGTRGSSFLEPDAIIMNPANWQNTRLLMDANNQFYGGGPFTGAYGNAGNGGNGIGDGQLTGSYDNIWGKPVIVTTAIGAGTALLGSFRAAAQLFRKNGVTVEATNAHGTNFASDIVTIRAEQRMALAVYRPSAFTKVTGLNS